MSDITFPSTHVRDLDTEWDLEAKILQILNGSGTGDLADDFAAAIASGAGGAASAALLTELQQKTEPADSQTVRGNLAIVAAEFTRPADTTQYLANDVVGSGSVITFTNVARVANGTGYITNARLVKSTATTSNATFRLWLYNVAPVATADNAPFQLLYVYRNVRIGYLDFPCSTEGTGSDSASSLLTNVNLKFAAALDTRNLFGVLEAKQAYAPGISEKFWIELTVDQN